MYLFLHFYSFFFIIAILLSISGLDFITSISGAASAISNVGPGLGDIIGPNGNYKAIPNLSKWILSIGMLVRQIRTVCCIGFIFSIVLEKLFMDIYKKQSIRNILCLL